MINHKYILQNDITPKISNHLLHQFTKAAIDNAWSTLGISRATAPWRQRPWSWLGGPGSTTGRWPGRLHGVLAVMVAHPSTPVMILRLCNDFRWFVENQCQWFVFICIVISRLKHPDSPEFLITCQAQMDRLILRGLKRHWWGQG